MTTPYFHIVRRLKSCFQAFFLCTAFCITLSACLETDPALDTTGDLKYTDLVIGTGATVSADTTIITQVGINYIAKLKKDSTVFQNSEGQTIFALVGSTGNSNNVGYGLDSMMRGMRVGGKRLIEVPPRFGFGNKKTGNVPANSTLIYEIDLRSAEQFIRQDIVVGTGDTVKVGNSITVKYIGRLTNGNIFDASTQDNNFTFSVGRGSVIAGWDIGVLGMRVGGKRRLSIPSLLGYGAQGSPPRIPGNSTLIFDIELISVSTTR